MEKTYEGRSGRTCRAQPGGLPHLGGHRLGVGGEEEAVLDLEAEAAKYAAQHLTYGQDCDAPGATVGVAFHLPDSS